MPFVCFCPTHTFFLTEKLGGEHEATSKLIHSPASAGIHSAFSLRVGSFCSSSVAPSAKVSPYSARKPGLLVHSQPDLTWGLLFPMQDEKDGFPALALPPGLKAV